MNDWQSGSLATESSLKKISLLKKGFSSFLAFSFLLFSVFPNSILALPQGEQVESGTATFDNTDAKTLVITPSDHAIINFNSFSIAANETVRFNQASSGSSVLARVTGGSSSDIFGSLFSNGQLVLVNQNGITFHDTANVQVGSLIASTLDIQSSLYLQNQFIFEKATGSNPGAILNQGTITAADGGHIALLAESINNQGTLTANLGSVVLSAGTKQTLSFDQNNLINLVVDRGVDGSNLGNASPLVQNFGMISANGGKIILSAKTLNDVLNTLINNQGILEATQVQERDGLIEFVANGQMSTSGTVSATNLKIDAGTTVNAGNTQFTIQKNELEKLLTAHATYSDKNKFLEIEKTHAKTVQELDHLNKQYEEVFEKIIQLEK